MLTQICRTRAPGPRTERRTEHSARSVAGRSERHAWQALQL